jgi:hypothetical protein
MLEAEEIKLFLYKSKYLFIYLFIYLCIYYTYDNMTSVNYFPIFLSL